MNTQIVEIQPRELKFIRKCAKSVIYCIDNSDAYLRVFDGAIFSSVIMMSNFSFKSHCFPIWCLVFR